MPLSEREQQILDELEKELRRDAPSSSPRATGSRERFVGLKVGVVLIVMGIVMLVLFFASGLVVVGVASFAAMVAGIVLGASSIHSEAPRGGGPRDRVARAMGGWEEWLRRRYRDKE